MIHCFVPVRRSWSSAVVRSAAASEPDSDSVSAKAASSWPWASGGTRRSRWSSVPWARIGSVPGAGVHRHGHAQAGVGARELLEHERVGEEVGADAAVLVRDADAHEPELAELGEDLAREAVLGVPRGRLGRDDLVGEAAREVADSRAARR